MPVEKTFQMNMYDGTEINTVFINLSQCYVGSGDQITVMQMSGYEKTADRPVQKQSKTIF